MRERPTWNCDLRVKTAARATVKDLQEAVEGASNFMDIGIELRKRGIKFNFSTESPMPAMYSVDLGGARYGILNKKYVDSNEADFVVGDVAVGKLASESPSTMIMDFAEKVASLHPGLAYDLMDLASGSAGSQTRQGLSSLPGKHATTDYSAFKATSVAFRKVLDELHNLRMAEDQADRDRLARTLQNLIAAYGQANQDLGRDNYIKWLQSAPGGHRLTLPKPPV